MGVLERYYACYLFWHFVYVFLVMSKRKSNSHLKIHMNAYMQLESHEESKSIKAAPTNLSKDFFEFSD